MTLSPAGQFLVNMNGSSGGVNIHFFDAANGKLLYTENGGPHGRLRWVCFFDSDRKAASIQGHKVRIWNARTGRDISQFALPMQKEEHALKISVAPDGKYFAFRTDDNPGGTQRIFVWDVEKQKIVREWPASSRSGALDFSPDNQWLAIRTDEKSVRLVRLGSPLADTLLPTGDSRLAPTSLAAFSPDGRQLVLTIMSESNKNSGGIAVYELASKKIRLKLVGHSEFGQFGSIGCLAFAKDSGLLATGAADTTVLVWRAGLSAFATQANKDATDDELARWFQQMAGADAEMAFQKMIKLTQAPRQTVKLFEEKIPPVKKPDSGEKSIPQWIQDLASPNFATRSRASAMLQKLGPSAESDLHAALPKAGDVESRRRIEEHLNRVAAYEWTARDVLHARAVEVLEAIATAEARALLTSWTTGERTAVLTVVAQRALARLKK
jgi:hypothetical protein